MIATMKLLVYLLLLSVMSSLISSCDGRRATKDWGKMDLEALEEQWKDGDDEDLLKSDKQLEFEKLERQRKEAEAARPKIDSRNFGSMSPQDMAAMTSQTKGMSGPAMMFATVGSGSPSDGESDVKLTQDETGVVGNRLQQLAQLGGLKVTVFAIDPGSLLVSTQRGWEGQEVLDFLISRPEVSKVTWNSRDFFPPEEDEL